MRMLCLQLVWYEIFYACGQDSRKEKWGVGRNKNCIRVVYIWLFPDISIITSGNTFYNAHHGQRRWESHLETGVERADRITLLSAKTPGSEEGGIGPGPRHSAQAHHRPPSLEAGTLATRFDASQAAGKAQFPALPEVVAQSFPGRREVGEDSEWVAAAAGPREGVSPEAVLRVWGSVEDPSPILFPVLGPRRGGIFS